MTGETVLISGGSGFIASHTIILALQQGYTVRTTVRSLKKSADVKQLLLNGGATEQQAESVQYFAADLTKDDGWEEACSGCDYVLHIASPFPATKPKNDDELIIPAREGTLRALRAAKKAETVKRVVVTSSFAAVGYGHGLNERTDANPFTEKDWTIVDHPKSPVHAYEKSKTLAERAAWDYIQKEGGTMELATVNPVGVFGPALAKSSSTSLELVLRLLNGSMPGMPQLSLGVVDVRDVADLHLRAMTNPKAAGQRYLAISDESGVWVKDMAAFLKEGLPAAETKKVPGRVLPNMLIKFAALFDGTIGLVAGQVGHVRPTSNAKAKTELDWKPRSAKEATLASGTTLKQYGAF